MKLWATMIWYAEPPTWLSATTASLSKMGVDHFVAIDGAFAHFDGEKRSGLEQAEAIMLAAEAVDMGCTIVRPTERWISEVEKRAMCFRLVEQLATPFVDWVTIIDADEIVREGSPAVRSELAALPADTHCAAARIYESMDPASVEGRNNNGRTPEMHRKIPLRPDFVAAQSRFWRVMRNMSVQHTHFGFVGDDAEGVRWNLRPDIGTRQPTSLPATEVACTLEHEPVFEHRDPWRTKWRRDLKDEYYRLRDELGLESIPSGV